MKEDLDSARSRRDEALRHLDQDWEEALAGAEATLASLGAEKESVGHELAALQEEETTALTEARSRLEAADAAVAEVRSRQEREQQEREALQQSLDRNRGELGVRREQEAEMEKDYGAWRLLLETLREAENEQAAHLGQALVGPIAERFRELTQGRYGPLALGPNLETQGIEAAGGQQAVGALSVGTREQLSTIFRLSLAQQLGTVVLLDDQLAQSDPGRMSWFRQLLRECAEDVQIVVLTCRPEDYLLPEEMPKEAGGTGFLDSTDDVVRAMDLVRIVERAGGGPDYCLGQK